VLDTITEFFGEGGDLMYPVAGIALVILVISADRAWYLIRTPRVPAAPRLVTDQVTTVKFRRAERGIRYLPALGCLAVLLGVLGTVLNLFMPFGGCHSADELAALLAKHISEIMSCTLFGLATAVLAMLLHGLLSVACRYRVAATLARRPGLPPSVPSRHATLLLAPVACLLCILTFFLMMGMSMEPLVCALPVGFEARHGPGNDTEYRGARDWRLIVSPERYEFCTHDGIHVEIPRGDLWLVSETLRTEFERAGRVGREKPGFIVQCDDDIRFQELVYVLDVCRSAGFTNLQITDSQAGPAIQTVHGQERRGHGHEAYHRKLPLGGPHDEGDGDPVSETSDNQPLR
jgi:hypothetical protein